MISKAVIPATVEQYIRSFPAATQKLLQEVRRAVKAVSPKAEEGIGYQMPAYKYQGVLVYFAGYKNHIGFYPTSSGIDAFKKELSVYKGAKGSVQFPLDQPMPLALITRIVKYRVKENEAAAAMKKATSKKEK